MSAYDGAAVCELTVIFILYQLSHKYSNNNIGLYSDDGLTVFKNISGSKADKIKKHFQNIFRKNNLNIIVKCILKIADYLEVTQNTFSLFCMLSKRLNYKLKKRRRRINLFSNLFPLVYFYSEKRSKK